MHLIPNTMNGINNHILKRKWWQPHKQVNGDCMCQGVEAIQKWILRFEGVEIAP